ncbi:right-handed parallel beta-helix repeat-containing protein [Sphingorhabdus sp. EL138]|uniref:right-handed parallel beta-helix repeat-containing protein n=1 Tax=Sphingorhabdus sp. EL138 TaxID=2073156 RepID=UPI0020B16DD6|nr:right-handed parallel beta-helix repeat-containing protein [Sphingorhabdus sp. EL138]
MKSNRKHRRGVLKAIITAMSSMALVQKTSARQNEQIARNKDDEELPKRSSTSARQSDGATPFIQSGTGARARSSDLKLREAPVSLEDFGGGINVEDNTPAIIAALKTNRPLHLVCPVPFVRATYRFAKTVDFGTLFQKDTTRVPVVIITGEGKDKTVLQYTGPGIGLIGGANAPVSGGYTQSLIMHNLSYIGTGRVPDEVIPSIPLSYFRFKTEANVFAGSDSSQTGIYWEFDAASTISNCEIARFGVGIKTRLGYGATIRSNHFRYNNIAIELTQAVTTITVVDNVIERNGIGIALYQSSLCSFRGNAIQGNYGGCDVYSFIWNKGHKFDSNYFEASSRVVVQDGGNSNSSLVNTAFEFINNIGLKVELKEFAENWSFRRNLMGDVNTTSSAPAFYCTDNNIRGIVVEDNLENHDARLRFTNYTGAGVKNLIVRDSPITIRTKYNMEKMEIGDSSLHKLVVPGSKSGDAVSVSFNKPINAVQLHGWVTESETVSVVFYNPPYGQFTNSVAGELTVEVFPKL